MTRPAGDDAALRTRLRWLIGLRAVSVTVLLGTTALMRAGGPAPALPVNPYLGLIAVTGALTAGYAATLRLVPRARWLVDVQLAVDACLAAAIVLVTGGIGSGFVSLFVLPVVAASVVQSRRSGLLVACLSAAFYAGLVVAQYTGALALMRPASAVAPALPSALEAWYSVVFNGAGFVAVGLLTGLLAERLREAGARLEDASSRFASLQAFNQHVIDGLAGGLVTTDREGRVLTVNRAAQAITGVPGEEVRGARVWDVLQLPPDFHGRLDAVVDGGRGRRREVTFVTAGGRALDLGLSITPLETGDGRAGFIFAFQDVTQEKRREREAHAQRRLAAVGEMAAGIAHEIRNPLASMAGSIQLLGQELTLTADQARLLDIVLRESRRLDETIGNFLAYARPRRRTDSRFEMRRLLNETALLLRNSPELAGRHRVDVQAPATDVWLEGDESQVRQVLWNLASNGVRAMPDGGRLVLRVEEVGGGGPEGAVAVSVQDEGVGMAAGDVEQIFHPFHSGFPRGAGLGLAIVHRIVTEHRGEIAVSSAPGQGTLIRVTLPRQAAPVAEADAGGADQVAPTGTYAGR